MQELLREARRLSSEGASQEEVVDYVQGVAAQHGLRARRDLFDPHAPPAEAEARAPAPLPGPSEPALRSGSPAPPAPETAPETAPPALEAAPSPPGTDGGPGPGAGADAAPRASEGRRRRGAKMRGRPVPAPLVRTVDGSQRLALGSLFAEAPAPCEAAPGGAEGLLPGRHPAAQTATVGRLVLSGERRGGGRRRAPICYEANGYVIDARTWRALAVPPRAFNTQPSARAVDPLLAEGLYDAVPVDDGTVLTLYRWAHPTDGDVWALASSKAYDVSGLYWAGTRAYAEVVYDLAQRLYPAFGAATGLRLERPASGPRLAFDSLDPAYCYTFGFRHHDFHPLRADPERMWNIQWTDLSDPEPRVLYGAQGAGLPGVPAQALQPLSDAPATLAALRARGADALERAARHIAARAGRAAGPAAPEPQPEPELCYGTLLRSRDPARTAENSDLLVESPLLVAVRRLAYERPPCRVRDQVLPCERFEYSALRAFLTAPDAPVFLSLYPDWEPRFREYEGFARAVVGHIINALRQRAMAPASREPRLDSASGRVARSLLNHIARHEALAPFDENTRGVVRDYVMDPEYAFLYLRALKHPK